MRKKIIAALFTGLLAVGMATGCGENSSPAQAASEPTADAEKETTEASGEAKLESGNQEREVSQGQAEETEENGGETGEKSLVVYFSATGNTEGVAEMIAEATGGELFQLEPVDPYTDEELNYNDDNSRVSIERNSEQREVELVAYTVEDWESISTVYIGYPIWWGEAAWPVDGFVKANDFTGKTVVPFCTSGSSGVGDSGRQLEEMAGTGQWLEGMRFSSSVSEEDVAAWVESIGL